MPKHAYKFSRAPEIVLSTDYGKECDVFSFGVMMHEIFFEKIPYCDQQQQNLQFRVATAELRPSLPMDESTVYSEDAADIQSAKKIYIQLMKDCWKSKPQERPNFDQVLDRFAEISALLPMK